MAKQRALTVLFVFMALVVVVIGAAAVFVQYQVAFDERRQRLLETTVLQAGFIDAIAPSSRVPSVSPTDADEEGLSALATRIGEAYASLPSRGGHSRVMIGRKVGDRVALLYPRRTEEAEETTPVLADPPDEEPMRRALAGETGTNLFINYRDESLLAAYAPVPGLGLGVVMQVPVSDIRRPYLQGAGYVLAIAIIIIVVGTVVHTLVSDRVIGRIREGQERFRGLFENMSTGAVVVKTIGGGRDYVVTDINRAGERIENVARGEIVGQELSAALPSFREFGLQMVLERVLHGGRPEAYVSELAPGDRANRWRDTYVYKLPNGELVILYDDITERKRAEESLLESEARLRSIIQMQADAILIVTADKTIRFANHAAEGLFHQQAAELIGSTFRYNLAEGDAFEIEIPRVDGTKALAEMRITTIAWDGENHYLLGLRDIKPRKRAEAELRKLFQAIEQSPVLVMITDVNGVIEYVNPTFCRVTGFTANEIVGQVSQMFKPGELPPSLFQELWQTIRAGSVWMGEFRTNKKDHTPFWERAAVGPVRDDLGRITHFVAVKEDITERKQTERQLRESERRLRSIIEMQSIAIFIVDSDNSIRFLNTAAAALLGRSSDDLIGAHFGYPVVERDITQIEIIRPDQGPALGEMQALPIRWGGEENFLVFIRDITAQHRAEQDLRKLSHAIEQSPVSVVITDLTGTIEYVNPKFTEVTGYTLEEAIGQSPSILKSGQMSPAEYAELWKTIKFGRVWRGEFLNRKKDGELFWELASIAPVRDDHGAVTHFVAVKEDITERKRTEDRLRASQRMEVIGQLTGGIAHDFNNLLAVMRGNLELLEEELAEEPDKKELVADALWSAERGAELTRHLLAFARRQPLHPKPTDINDVIEGMAGLLRRTLGERIKVTTKLTPSLGKAMIDASQLENAILNLVVNARDAMPDGGTVTIETCRARVESGRPANTDNSEPVPAGDYIRVAVRDTGTGMPPDMVKRVVEPFFTTKKFGKGSGLGLSMVYGFVRQSGGSLNIDSVVGRGTVVTLDFPEIPADETAETEAAMKPPTHPLLGNETILVVEDDARVRKAAVHTLRRLGYTVVEAAHAGEALEVLENLQSLDLLFTDIVLPEGPNGFELARLVQGLRPEARVLFTSGYAKEAMIGGEYSETDGPILAKPYRREDLTHGIAAALNKL